MSTSAWLLTFHITGAFLFLGGSVLVGVLMLLSLRQDRPSDVASHLRLIRASVIPVGAGALLVLIFGLALVHDEHLSYGAFWIWAAIALWLVANALGGIGGRRQKAARVLAEQLAAGDDTPNEELRSLLRDPVNNALSWASGVAALLVLVLMIWKPGS
jgi:uncharacterized membrane protein